MAASVTKCKVKGAGASKKDSSRVTISVHCLTSLDYPVGTGKRPEFHDDVFVLVALGGKDEINLPSEFYYHDTQNVWKSRTWEENNPELASCVREDWPGDDQTVENPTMYSLYHPASKTETSNKIRLLHKGGDVRCVKRSNILDIWAHSPNSKSIINHLLDIPDFVEWYNGLNRKHDITAEVKQVYDQFFGRNSLPTSSKYATIQFCFSKIAQPNQMGAKSSQYDFTPRSCVSPSFTYAEIKPAHKSSLLSSETGARPKQALSPHATFPSEGAGAAVKSPRSQLVRKNADKAHFKFSRPDAVFKNIRVDYIVNDLIPDVDKEPEWRFRYQTLPAS